MKVVMQYINKTFDVVKKHSVAIIFCSTFISILFFDFLKPYPFVFYYDSKFYWDLSQSFVGQNGFSFLNFNDEMRGYLFPFIIFLIRELAQKLKIPDDVFYVFFMAFVYTMFLVIWIPAIVRHLFKRVVIFWGTIVFSVLMILFWHSLMFYPLSDLLPILFAVISALFMISRKNFFEPILAGVFLGGAILIRPVYTVTLPIFILWFIFLYYKELNLTIKKIISSLLLFCLGVIVICAPQFAINLHHFSTWNPFVKSEIGGTNIYSAQLRWGIVIQKFEGNVNLLTYPRAGVYFLDRHGEAILIKENYSFGPTSAGDVILPVGPATLKDYSKLVLKYPLDFMFIYARHLFNGLDIVFSSLYNKDVYNSNNLLRIINYSVWFVFFVYTSQVSKSLIVNNFIDSRYVFLIAFIFPSIMSIPTAIEVRFMLPIQMVAYALVAFWVLPIVSTRNVYWAREMLSRYLPWYLVFIGICFSFSLNTYLDMQFGSYILSR